MAVVCGPCCTATRPDPSPKKSNPHKEKRFQKTCPGGVHWSGLFRRRPSPDSKEVGSENEKPAGQKLNNCENPDPTHILINLIAKPHKHA